MRRLPRQCFEILRSEPLTVSARVCHAANVQTPERRMFGQALLFALATPHLGAEHAGPDGSLLDLVQVRF